MKKLRSIFLLTLLWILCLSTVAADETKIAWEGYGLYNLNKADTSFIGETTKINIDENEINVNSEYIIKNNQAENTQLVVGLPFENFDEISLYDKGNLIKTNTIMRTTISKSYGEQAEIPQLKKWKNATILLEPNETRTIVIKYNKAIAVDKGTPTHLKYFYDREGNTNCAVDFADITIQTEDTSIYDYFHAYGATQSYISGQNKYNWQITKSNTEGIGLSYYKIWEGLLYQYQNEADKDLRNIATYLVNKEYSKVIELGETLINKPELEAHKNIICIFMQEAYASIGDFVNYEKTYQTIDYSKIPYIELSNKLIFDRVNTLTLMNKAEDIKKEINAYTNNTTLSKVSLFNKTVNNQTFNNILKETEAKIKKQVENQEQTEPITNEKGRNTLFIKIGKAIKTGFDFVMKNIFIFLLIVILIILLILYRKRKRRNRNRIRFR